MKEDIEKILRKSLEIKIEKVFEEKGDWKHECIIASLLFNGKVISSDRVVMHSSYDNDELLENFEQM